MESCQMLLHFKKINAWFVIINTWWTVTEYTQLNLIMLVDACVTYQFAQDGILLSVYPQQSLSLGLILIWNEISLIF